MVDDYRCNSVLCGVFRAGVNYGYDISDFRCAVVALVVFSMCRSYAVFLLAMDAFCDISMGGSSKCGLRSFATVFTSFWCRFCGIITVDSFERHGSSFETMVACLPDVYLWRIFVDGFRRFDAWIYCNCGGSLVSEGLASLLVFSSPWLIFGVITDEIRNKQNDRIPIPDENATMEAWQTIAAHRA